jgi:hypothetical protein
VFRSLDQRDAAQNHFGWSHFNARFAFCPERLHRHPVSKNGVVPDLIELAGR